MHMSAHKVEPTDICYIVSHGFAARMVLQTGLLERLVRNGKRVALIAPDIGDTNLRDYAVRQGFRLYAFKAPKNYFTTDYMNMRKYFLEDIRHNPGLWAKHLQAIHEKNRRLYFRLSAHIYYGVYQLIKIFPFIRTLFKAYENKILRSPRAEALIREINPALVVATYPVNLPESMLLRAGQQQGIKTAIHLLSWDNITCKGHFPALADYYIAWGPVMKSEFQAYYGIGEERIYECGVPHFDEHIGVWKNPDATPFLRNMGLDPAKPYLFVAMSSPVFAPTGIDIVEWLAAQVSAGTFGQDMQLVVRPHPQNVQRGMADKSWLPRLDAIRNDRVGVDYPDLVESELPWSMQHSDMLKLSNLLTGCAVCLNFGSTVSIDALVVEKPVIVIAFDAEKELPWYISGRRQMDYVHYRKLIALGGVRVAWSFDDLSRELDRYLSDPETDREQRRHTLLQECGDNDGRATERVAAALEKLLSRAD